MRAGSRGGEARRQLAAGVTSAAGRCGRCPGPGPGRGRAGAVPGRHPVPAAAPGGTRPASPPAGGGSCPYD